MRIMGDSDDGGIEGQGHVKGGSVGLRSSSEGDNRNRIWGGMLVK
jgi:hypothetical protein